MIYSFSNWGYEGSLVTVEVDLRRGIPATDIVGLADSCVKEERERVQAAIRNSGLEYPSERVLISLSPADLKKVGAGFDLAIALGILQKDFKESVLVMGELDLSGGVRLVRGVHAACSTALASGILYAIVPNVCLNEALETGINAIGCDTLSEAFKIPDDLSKMKFESVNEYDETISFREPYDEQKFIMTEKEMLALVVGAAGRFNMMFYGSPGCGKTALMEYMQYLTPSLTYNESRSVKRIYSLAGMPSKDMKIFPPFRIPHQTASIEGICGGGPNCRPGEITLAHNGVLLIDEAAEFRCSVLQMLRVPMENHTIMLSRAGRTTVYPANFQLLLALNPCPCGNYGSSKKLCLCSAKSVEMYWRKLGEPLLDRVPIRLHIDPEEGERKEYALAELQSYVKKATEESRRILGVTIRDLTVEEICNNTPTYIHEKINEIAESYGWSVRRRYDLCRIWLAIMYIFDDNVENYTDYLDKAVSLMSDFAFYY